MNTGNIKTTIRALIAYIDRYKYEYIYTFVDCIAIPFPNLRTRLHEMSQTFHITDPAHLRDEVTRLIRADTCPSSCLLGKASELESFLMNLWSMTPTEKRVCVMTSLSILSSADVAQPIRTRGVGARKRFNYYLPFVGRVCKQSFLHGFNVSGSTIARYKRDLQGDGLMGSVEVTTAVEDSDEDESDDEALDEDAYSVI
jgi:hypothetical protein